MSHVQVLTVQPTTLTRTLRLTGAVAYNSFRTTPVITQVSGPVSRVVVVPGQKVHQGEPMLYVASPDYSQLRTNYLKATDAYALAQESQRPRPGLVPASSHRRTKCGAGAVRRNPGRRRSRVGASRAESHGHHRSRRRCVNAPPSFEVPVKAPISGLVVEQDVAAGQLIQPGTTQCFMISDVSSVWVLVNVYQKDLPYVRVGDTVAIQTDTLSRSLSTGALPTSPPHSIPRRARCRHASTPTIPARS